jgi:predicted porin
MQNPSRIFLALAAAGFASLGATAAHAGTDVSIYGVVDVYAAVQKGDRTETRLDSGGLSGSRLGFSASHDLPAGLKVLGRLEAGVAADNGMSTQGGRTWGRQAWVGLAGSFGTVMLGRQYTPTFVALDTDDPFDAAAGSSVSNGIVSIVGGPRADNAIGYESPKLGPVSIYAMAALAESASSNTRGNYYGVNVRYSEGALGVGLTYSMQQKAVDNGADASSITLGASYDFGGAKLMGGLQYVKNTTRAANLDDDREEAFIGVQVPMGDGSLWAGAGTGRFKDISDTRASQASIGYLHNLDKSTTLYVVGTTVKNGAVGTLSDGAGNFFAASADTATGAGPAVSQGRDAHQVIVGLRYRF